MPKFTLKNSKTSLVIIFGLILILGTTVYFSTQPSDKISKLFKGYIDLSPDGQVECNGQIYTGTQFNALPEAEKEPCLKESIENMVKSENCTEINDMLNMAWTFRILDTDILTQTYGDPEAMEQLKQILTIAEPILLGESKTKACTEGEGIKIYSLYGDEELQNIDSYCPPLSFSFTEDTYELLTGESALDNLLVDGFKCFPMQIYEEGSSTGFNLAQLFEYGMEAYIGEIDLSIFKSCENLEIIKTNENNQFKLTKITETILEQMIANDCGCPQGSAYVKDGNGTCTLSCNKGLQLAKDSYEDYYLEVALNSPKAAKLKALNKFKGDLKEIMEGGCYGEGTDNEMCSKMAAIIQAPGVSADEIDIINELQTDLGCCSGIGEEDVNGECKVTAEELFTDFRDALTLYKLSIENNDPQATKTLQLTKLLAAGDLFNKKFEELNINAEVKKNTFEKNNTICPNIKTILNEDQSTIEDDKDILIEASKKLDCCNNPDEKYGFNDKTGEYICYADAKEMYNAAKAEPQCSENYPEKVSALIANLDNFVAASHDENKLAAQLDAIEVLVNNIPDGCKLKTATTSTGDMEICSIPQSALQEGFDIIPDTAKPYYDKLMNDILDCCSAHPFSSFDVYAQYPGGIACKQESLEIPQFESITATPNSFDPTKNEKIYFDYSLDTMAGEVEINILNGNELTIKTLIDDDVGSGQENMSWDGKDTTGAIVSNGIYKYQAIPSNIKGQGKTLQGSFAVVGVTAANASGEAPPTLTFPGFADDTPPTCGDGIKNQTTEECDPPNGTTCSTQCKTIDTPPPPPVCGNGVKEITEECDPPNGTTCSSGCKKIIPGGNDDDDNDDDTDTNTDIEIIDHDVFPKGFNPLINDTKISYEISAQAKIELTIINESGITMVALIDDETIDKGDYYIWWDGTDTTTTGGNVVAPGKYFYKIKAKDPDNGITADTATGQINVMYSVVGGDFEDYEQPPEDTTPGTPGETQNHATLSMQNAVTGTTSGTGPGVIIYTIFPLIGYFLTRRKK